MCIPLHIVLPRSSFWATNNAGRLRQEYCLSLGDLQWVSYEIAPSILISVLSLMVLPVSILWRILLVVCGPCECHTRVQSAFCFICASFTFIFSMSSCVLAVAMNNDGGRSTISVLSCFPWSTPGGLDSMSGVVWIFPGMCWWLDCNPVFLQTILPLVYWLSWLPSKGLG